MVFHGYSMLVSLNKSRRRSSYVSVLEISLAIRLFSSLSLSLSLSSLTWNFLWAESIFFTQDMSVSAALSFTLPYA